jgi:hypothetical protein
MEFSFSGPTYSATRAILSMVTAFADVSDFVRLPVVEQANLTSKQNIH